jgi:1-acyl-sn-glycerol-3-phosphate acyltransferase
VAEPVYSAILVIAKSGFRLLGLKFRLSGSEHLPRTGGVVMALNHNSYLDFTFGGLVANERGRLVRFMAKKAVFDHRVSGPLMRGMKHIPVDRSAGAASYAEAVAALRRGEVVGVFPEATISESFDLKEFKTGAARMALEAGVPLLPVALWGGQRVFTKGHKKDLRRGTHVRIVTGELFQPEPGADPAAVTKELKERVARCLDEARATYDGKPRTPDDTWWIPASMGGTAPTLEDTERRRLAD